MSTLMELEEPFRTKWRKGYLQTHPNGRNYICLYNSVSDRSLISYARYLLSVKEGHFLSKEVEADHINGVSNDDRFQNLQPLPAFQNKTKAFFQQEIQEELRLLVCPNCWGEFVREAHEVDFKLRNGKTPFCSRRCASLYYHNCKKILLR